jgi:hypothetical protein
MTVRRAPFFLAASAAAALVSLCRDAHALEPVDVEIAAVVGAGTTPTSHGGAPLMPVSAADPLGFGLGGRAGVEFHHIYAGIEGMYYVGTTADSPYYVTVSSYLLGVAFGYGLTLSSVTIRPLVGIGDFTELANEIPAPGGPATPGANLPPLPNSLSQSYSTLYIQPGVTALVSAGTHYYVGADANVLILTSLPATFANSAANDLYVAFTFHFQVGARF